jgi:GWxTD domain-containing protein
MPSIDRSAALLFFGDPSMTLRTILLAIVLGLAVLAATSSPPPAGTPDVVVDIVQFRGDGARTRWEFQYSFPDTAVRYAVGKEGFTGELLCSLEVVSELGDTTRDEWIASATSPTSNPRHERFYAGVRTMLLTPGKYLVRFVATDLNDPANTLASTFSSTVRAFTFAVSMSDIMFVAPMRDGSDPRFQRNGQPAIPNPRHEIVGADPSVCVYAEVYNAQRARVDTFVVEYQVLDHVREEMFTGYLVSAGGNDGIVIREEIPAGALRSGVYTLRIRILTRDLATVYASTEERFFILNPELPPQGRLYLTESEQFQASEWAVTTGDRLELELALSDVLASNAEKAVRAECTDERSKQRYLFRFWKERDPDEKTEANERLDEFRSMYKRAQAFYGNPTFPDGWKSDRGITLLRFGVPTQVTQYIQTIDTKPYEEWFYQGIQGGVYFYFVDWQLQQNHRLVHSTMIGQVREPNWFNIYAKAFEPNPNPLQSLQPNKR